MPLPAVAALVDRLSYQGASSVPTCSIAYEIRKAALKSYGDGLYQPYSIDSLKCCSTFTSVLQDHQRHQPMLYTGYLRTASSPAVSEGLWSTRRAGESHSQPHLTFQIEQQNEATGPF